MALIIVCDARPEPNEGGRITASLRGMGITVDFYTGGPKFLEAAVAGLPAVVVYALSDELETDLGVLRLLRRMQPDVEIVLLADHTSLTTRVAAHPLRPMYCSVGPLDPAEVTGIVQAALRRRERLG